MAQEQEGIIITVTIIIFPTTETISIIMNSINKKINRPPPTLLGPLNSSTRLLLLGASRAYVVELTKEGKGQGGVTSRADEFACFSSLSSTSTSSTPQSGPPL